MLSLLDNIGEGVMFQAVPFSRSFVPSDTVTMTSHKRLEHFYRNERVYSTAPTDNPIRFWRSKVKGLRHSKSKYVVAYTSMSTLERQSQSSSSVLMLL